MTLDRIIEAIGVEPYHREECGAIYHADCLDILPKIPEKSIDLVLTDPPFKISQSYTANVDADNLSAVSKIWPASMELFKTAKNGAYFAMYYDTRILPLAIEAMRWANWKYLRGLTFYRRWGNAHKLYGWMSTSDFILIFRKPSESGYLFYSDDWRHDVYLKDKPEETGFHHSAQKPILDIQHLIGHLSPANGICIDPFLGSGTTAVAAKQLGRQFIGIEIEQKYCDIAVQRLSQEVLTL